MSVTETESVGFGNRYILSVEGDNTVAEPKKNWYDEDSGEKKCHRCGEWFQSIGSHWAYSEETCPYPELSETQKDVVNGIALSGRYIGESSGTSINLYNREFAGWMVDILNYSLTGTVQIEHLEDSDRIFDENVEMLDEIRITTHNPHKMSEFSQWEQDSGLVEPDGIQLTPLMLKVWYGLDNSLKDYQSGETQFIIEKVWPSEIMNDLFEPIFKDSDVEYNQYQYDYGSVYRFPIPESAEIFECMGDPLPGLEWKWPDGPSYEEAKEDFATVNGDPYREGVYGEPNVTGKSDSNWQPNGLRIPDTVSPEEATHPDGLDADTIWSPPPG